MEQHNALGRQKNARVRQEAEEHGTYDALRRLGAPLPGTRPAPLPEIAGQQGRPVAPSSPDDGLPSLASPTLAGKGVDSSTLAFLAAHAVQVREEEEGAEELRQLDERLATAEGWLVKALDPVWHEETRPRTQWRSTRLSAAVLDVSHDSLFYVSVSPQRLLEEVSIFTPPSDIISVSPLYLAETSLLVDAARTVFLSLSAGPPAGSGLGSFCDSVVLVSLDVQ